MKTTDTAKIEVTEEMIQAGLEALENAYVLPESTFALGQEEKDAVRVIFLAMLERSSILQRNA